MIAMATAPSKIPARRVGKNLERRVDETCGADSAAIFPLSSERLLAYDRNISIGSTAAAGCRVSDLRSQICRNLIKIGRETKTRSMVFYSRTTRREMMRRCGIGLLSSPLLALWNLERTNPPTPSDLGPPYQGTDDQLLDEIQRAAFDFFWNEASHSTGQIKDRALAKGNDSRLMSSIAATGFGLTGLCIAHQRGYGKSADIV